MGGASGVRGVKAVPNGKAASFAVGMLKATTRGMYKAIVAKVKHLPEDIAEDGFRNFQVYEDRVVELRVSGWNGKAFRWAKFIRFRDDKGITDCKFEEQIGKARDE